MYLLATGSCQASTRSSCARSSRFWASRRPAVSSLPVQGLCYHVIGQDQVADLEGCWHQDLSKVPLCLVGAQRQASPSSGASCVSREDGTETDVSVLYHQYLHRHLCLAAADCVASPPFSCARATLSNHNRTSNTLKLHVEHSYNCWTTPTATNLLQRANWLKPPARLYPAAVSAVSEREWHGH